MSRTILFLIFLLSVLAAGQSASSPNRPTGSDATASAPQVAPARLAVPYYQADFTPVIANGVHAVVWDKGHLVSFSVGEVKEPVALFDKTGKWLFEDSLNFEGAVKVYGHDAAVTSSGTGVFAGAALNADGAVADVLTEVTKIGIRRVIRTSPFNPLKVCTTDEGTVWTYGQEMTPDRTAEARAHYPMLREYSFDKGEIKSALDRATFHPAKGVPITGTRSDFYMMCSRGKVVLISGPTNELMQYDLAASRLQRWPIAPLGDKFYFTGAAVTDSGEVYVSVLRPGQNALSGVLHLHLNPSGTVEWTPLAMAPPKKGDFFLLLGSDGESLVYSRGRSAPTVFWSQTQKMGVTK